MPRTIDADLLAALVTGTYDVSFQVIHSNATITRTFTPVKFKLTGDRLSVTSRGEYVAGSQTYDANDLLQLVRTFTVAGTTYTVSTSKFFIRSIYQDKVTQSGGTMIIETTFEASLAPQKRISFAADVTYEQAISAFCTAIGRTYTLRNPTAAWWDYQFYPTGKYFTTNDADTFFSALKSKYFIFACDNGSNDILFYHALDRSAADYAISTDRTFTQKTTFSVNRYYLARDENATIRTAGTTTNQMHNLGFLKSTDSFPAYYNQKTMYTLNQVPANLKYLDGDCTEESEAFGYLQPLVVTEIYDPSKSPSWSMDIAQLEYFTNTQGGAMPSTIERVAAYTPLVSTGFDGNLDADVNNLQALAEAVDNLDFPPSSKGVTNGDSHDHSGGDGAQIAYSTLSGTPTIRDVLAANRTYYVRTDGNDSNTGLANTSGGAFLTIQKAVDVVASLDQSIYDVTIQIADGTYNITAAITLKKLLGAGKCSIIGNTSTPANVVISSSVGCFYLNSPSHYVINGMQLSGTAGSPTLYVVSDGALLQYLNVIFIANATSFHILVMPGKVECIGAYTISGGANVHAYALNGGLWVAVTTCTITITNNPAWGSYFVLADTLGVIISATVTFSGACTGSRYGALLNGIVQSWWSGANYFPGNAAGITATGGQYN